MLITSTQNPRIKELKKLKATAKNLIFLDNPKVIEEAINAGLVLKELIVSDARLDILIHKFVFLQNILHSNLTVATERVVDSLSDVETSQGIVAVFENNPKELEAPKGNFLILDHVQDAGNVGTILRTALGADFTDVYLVNCANINSPKVIRSAMGATFKLNLYAWPQNEFMQFADLNLRDKTILACDMNGENLYESKIHGQVGLILGNEGNGICEEIKGLATKTVRIPMLNGLESLNVAVAGSVVMLQICNQKGE